MGRRIARADVQRHGHVGVGDRLEHRVPIVVVDAGQALHRGVLVHRDGAEALVRQPVNLEDSGVDVPCRKDADGNEAAGIGHAPFLIVPVIVGLHVTQRERLVRRLVEGLAVEANGIAEAHRDGNAVHVHVVDPRMHVVAALAKLIERGRLHAIFLERPADHGIQANRRADVALILPEILALRVSLELGRGGEQVARKLVVEKGRRFADVIVRADQHHVVHLHCLSPFQTLFRFRGLACLFNAIGRGSIDRDQSAQQRMQGSTEKWSGCPKARPLHQSWEKLTKQMSFTSRPDGPLIPESACRGIDPNQPPVFSRIISGPFLIGINEAFLTPR